MVVDMLLAIKTYPRAKRNSVEISDDDTFIIPVAAAPEKDKANSAAVKLLASKLDVPKSSVLIVRGHTSRDKVIRVDGITGAELKGRLLSADRPATAEPG